MRNAATILSLVKRWLIALGEKPDPIVAKISHRLQYYSVPSVLARLQSRSCSETTKTFNLLIQSARRSSRTINET